jgi:signal transduction histidine kinase
VQTGGEGETAARERAELEAIRRRVVNVVGHALRTPVTTIAGMASALATAEDDETRAMLVDGLARNARRVELLLDDLLIASGVTTALPIGEPAMTRVRDAVQAAWRAADGRGQIDIDGEDHTLVVRAAALERILCNLFDNALKYGHGTVRVSIELAPGQLCVYIESPAGGPTDEELEHAFELLYRSEHAVMSSLGLGIGLPVARELARAEGGDVTLGRHGDALVATVSFPA